jgi:drug/metabolite transporter (DMT)-like permease
MDPAYAVLMVQSLLAAGTHIVAKVVVRSVDPQTLTLVRSLIAMPVMVGLLLSRNTLRRVERRDVRLIVFLSILAIPINQYLYLFGMRYTIASNAALLYAMTPIIVLVLSRWLLGEVLTQRKILGVALAFVGAVVVIFERGLSASVEHVYGNLLVFIAVLAWSLYTVYGRRLIASYGAIESTALILVGGTIAFLPIGIVSMAEFPFASLSTASWMQILYLSLITSVLSYLLWYYALGRVEAGKVALFTNLQPILTTALAVALLGQDVTFLFILGGGIAITGVIVAQFG